tara:strand:+ start:954 stop:1130 length:177 start_codon:yes stop_codon:yes gene_type:complete
MSVSEKQDLVNTLRREIAYAESKVRPSATGNIITAISWMESRVEELETQLNEEYLEAM